MVESRRSQSGSGKLLGRNIRAKRKARGWTQAQLAERIGVDTETVSRLERGAALPSIRRLEKIGKVLRAGIAELLAESSTQPDDQAVTLSAWLSDMDEADRIFLLGVIKQSVEHLRSRR